MQADPYPKGIFRKGSSGDVQFLWLGFCRGLSAAFQKQEAEHQEWGLVMVVPQAVEDAVSKMKRSSYKISSTSSMNRQYAAMGYADGQEFDMHRRLEPSA